MNQTKIKGLTTELKSQAYFTQLGYNVSVPLGEDCKYDFILDLNSKLLRIQVKTCKEEKTGFSFSCQTSYLLSSRSVWTPYTKKDIDLFCTYYNDVCYLVPVELCGTKTKKLCFEKSNSLFKEYLYFQDYQAENILKLIENDFLFLKKEYKIGQYSLKGDFIKSFNSCREASAFLGKSKNDPCIGRCIKGERKTAYGYIWKLIEAE